MMTPHEAGLALPVLSDADAAATRDPHGAIDRGTLRRGHARVKCRTAQAARFWRNTARVQ